MGNFYFDESIHDEAGFIIGAFVYSSDDLNELGKTIFERNGLEFGKDEFKSSNITDGNATRAALRSDMKKEIMSYKIGFVVIPTEKRSNLGDEAILCLQKIISKNNLQDNVHEVFFDEEISVSKSHPSLRIHTSQKSHDFFGIQLADLCAHTLSIMLREELGLIKKTVMQGSNAGFDPEIAVPLGHEMWAAVRYSFFTQDTIQPFDLDKGWNLSIEPYAFYISEDCDARLRKAVTKRFETIYVGCIH